MQERETPICRMILGYDGDKYECILEVEHLGPHTVKKGFRWGRDLTETDSKLNREITRSR